jgi:hypothetical protein
MVIYGVLIIALTIFLPLGINGLLFLRRREDASSSMPINLDRGL